MANNIPSFYVNVIIILIIKSYPLFYMYLQILLVIMESVTHNRQQKRRHHIIPKQIITNVAMLGLYIDCRRHGAPFTNTYLIPSWMNNHMSSKVWDKITYPFPNFNGATVEVWEWINNFIPHF